MNRTLRNQTILFAILFAILVLAPLSAAAASDSSAGNFAALDTNHDGYPCAQP